MHTFCPSKEGEKRKRLGKKTKTKTLLCDLLSVIQLLQMIILSKIYLM